MTLRLLLALALLPFTAQATSAPILLHTLGGAEVEPVLAVSLTLQRVDGKPTLLPTTYLQCRSVGTYLRCDGVDYEIAGVTFSVK